LFQKQTPGWAQVIHACNPSYSGGRDQMDRSSNSSKRPYLKKKTKQQQQQQQNHKKGLVEWHKVRAWNSIPSTGKKKKKGEIKKHQAGRVAQVVEHLPRKCEALNSHPSTTRKC
jgi:hypothetical protein